MITGVNNIGHFIKLNTDNVKKAEGARKQGSAFSEAERINVKNNKEVQAEELREALKVEIKNSQARAFFALDENENVVIRIVDSEGKLLRQIPPEEYLKMVEHMRNYTKNIFSVEV